jgi:hypothetical protein
MNLLITLTIIFLGTYGWTIDPVADLFFRQHRRSCSAGSSLQLKTSVTIGRSLEQVDVNSNTGLIFVRSKSSAIVSVIMGNGTVYSHDIYFSRAVSAIAVDESEDQLYAAEVQDVSPSQTYLWRINASSLEPIGYLSVSMKVNEIVVSSGQRKLHLIGASIDGAGNPTAAVAQIDTAMITTDVPIQPRQIGDRLTEATHGSIDDDQGSLYVSLHGRAESQRVTRQIDVTSLRTIGEWTTGLPGVAPLDVVADRARSRALVSLGGPFIVVGGPSSIAASSGPRTLGPSDLVTGSTVIDPLRDVVYTIPTRRGTKLTAIDPLSGANLCEVDVRDDFHSLGLNTRTGHVVLTNGDDGTVQQYGGLDRSP